ncbi:hypothetical protein BDV11DRAFT_141367 [Aspergillus similis]
MYSVVSVSFFPLWLILSPCSLALFRVACLNTPVFCTMHAHGGNNNRIYIINWSVLCECALAPANFFVYHA